MSSYSDDQLLKLKSYLEENATELANDNRISKIPYYPNDITMRSYQWTIIKVPNLGTIEMYFTGMSSNLSINGIYVESERVKSFEFSSTERIILEAFDKKKINDSNDFFDKI